MHYVEVLVASAAYHGTTPLTYSSDESLQRGTIVVAPLRNQKAIGVVVREASKPKFTTKPLIDVPDLPRLPEHQLSLLEWMPTHYPSPIGIIAQYFLPKQLPPKAPKEIPSLPHSPINLPELTDDQRNALAQIGVSGLHLLHGETGTGKTRVYIEMARRALKDGSSAIILTPEISLTPQLANDFRNVFGDKVVVMHSQLSEATRRDLWFRLLKQDEPVVVIGPRSALFMPLKKIGLIVVDESHEPAYKQDKAPYYHASRVASKLAKLAEAPIILGSATPTVVDYFIAEQKKRPIVRMQQTAAVKGAKVERAISVVDLRDHAKFSKSRHLSDTLIKAISETLNDGGQTLLFLNRRGTARVVFCENCGWQATCPHCDLPLVYHGDTHRMRCHTCDFSAANPTSCPSCGSTEVVYKSIGTKAVADEVARLFPDVKIARFDSDNKKDERIEQHYDAVRGGNVDIIIGTQTLAKGLDLPNLSLVGVIVADTSLYMPDFTAEERTYQLLSQVIGRVGRGHRDEGSVVIQTYAPDSPVLKAVLKQNWDDFYHKELAERQTFMFPPFCHLLKLTCRRASSASAQKAAEQLATQIASLRLGVSIDGPAPAFHEKSQGKFAWQLVVKAKRRDALLQIIADLPSGWSYDIDPLHLM